MGQTVASFLLTSTRIDHDCPLPEMQWRSFELYDILALLKSSTQLKSVSIVALGLDHRWTKTDRHLHICGYRKGGTAKMACQAKKHERRNVEMGIVWSCCKMTQGEYKGCRLKSIPANNQVHQWWGFLSTRRSSSRFDISKREWWMASGRSWSSEQYERWRRNHICS